MACGTGKTLVARFLHDALARSGRWCWCRRCRWSKQTIREWATVGDVRLPRGLLRRHGRDEDERDAVVASTSELGVPVTTDPGRDRALPPEAQREDAGRVRDVPVVAADRGRAERPRARRSTSSVADEAHRCAGPEAGVFATVLDPAKIKARKRLFMTATPRYYTGRVKQGGERGGLGDRLDGRRGEVRPRPPPAHVRPGHRQDLLSDYQVVVVGVTDDEATELAERGAFVTADGEDDHRRPNARQPIGLLRAMRNHDLHRVVSFHSRIDSASRFATSLPEMIEWMPARRRPTGTLWTQHVSGEMTSGEREARLNQLGRSGAASAACSRTPAASPRASMCRPSTVSPSSTRAAPRWTSSRPSAERCARPTTRRSAPSSSPSSWTRTPTRRRRSTRREFDRVWQVVKALRAHDEVLADELDELRRELGRRGTRRERPGKIVLDLPVGVGSTFARAFDTRVVERTTSEVGRRASVQPEYHASHGTCASRSAFITDGRIHDSEAGSANVGVNGEGMSCQLSESPNWTAGHGLGHRGKRTGNGDRCGSRV